MSLTKILNLIGGRLVEPQSGEWLDNYEPATGTFYSQVANSIDQDIELAVTAATKAAPGWAKMPAAERSRLLFRLADLIDRDAAKLAEAESKDNGKTLKLASAVDIPRASTNFRFFAGAVLGYGSQSHNAPGSVNYTLRKPHGVVACISPWNLPLYLLTWKIAPALAAGNCVIAKPSELTPMTAFLLAQLSIEAGLPPGVLNIVHGLGGRAGNALISHPGVKAVSFTGGTVTGRHIAATIAPQFKKYSLEMGGKNPTLIFADCDYERMLPVAVRSAFANQGQICLCGSRILVEDSIYDRFREDFVRETNKLKVGDPRDKESDLGAVVSQPHQTKILAAIETAQQEGGQILAGGSAGSVPGRCENGWFVQPTVIDGLSNDCSTNQNEIFGPVVTLQPFESAGHAIELANGTKYGLSATIWSGNIDRAVSVAEEIDSGVVWINDWLVRDLRTPFGGMKESGVGREGGMAAFDFWTEPKNVGISFLA
jgi:aminomuconate-semialdehyde/2-hydroxymuconate-6-semialdehyde dehydrogenase